MNNNITCCSACNPDFSETVAYNNPLFPVYIRTGTLSAYPDYSAVSHWHEDLEFIIIRKGSMTYNINGELTALPEGSGIMVNSRQLHYGFSPDHKECEFICILFSPGLLSGNEWFYHNYIKPVTENPLVPSLYLGREAWTISILEKLNQLYSASAILSPQELPYFSLIETFLSIMKTLYENLDVKAPDPARESNDLTALRNMITYIEEHFPRRITLADIASSGACCKSRCSLLFKKYLRETPMTYTTRLRLQKSLIPLLDSDQSIADIACAYGFCGASYYCETFRKYYGTSPLKYRETQTCPDCRPESFLWQPPDCESMSYT